MKVAIGSGKRKTAIARAVVKEGKGRIRVNRVPVEIWEPELARLSILEPIYLVGDKVKGIDIEIKVRGGGVMSQAEASRTAVARAILNYFEDPEIEKIFKSYDRTLIVNDVRRKLPKLPLGRGARKRRQKSYR
ncbi:30S ribosomal protein S9 [Euryarchaeota archaeon ex4484_178]|nr:30S ribosomal protein S9 [Thermoplasmata archaeon]OYT58183.1 MAG: 30S ribosomal protein S9 [Euryarchaeota archaeon ex4484_178]